MIISNELLAAYMEDNVTEEERAAVRKYLSEHPEVMRDLTLMADTDSDITIDDRPPISTDEFVKNLSDLLDEVEAEEETDTASGCDILPWMEMAANNTVDCLCAVKCEGLALRALGIDISDDELLKTAEKEGWLKTEGMALHNIGHLCGLHGMSISHRFGCSLNDIDAALLAGNIVVAAVDGNELTGDLKQEAIKDLMEGGTPNHTVVVLKIEDGKVYVDDPATSSQTDSYPIPQFVDAWDDSFNYMIVVSASDNYEPHPIDLSDVDISDDLLDLREAIAEQAHEVWALNRKKEGWTYGPVRDDKLKEHPDMVAYSKLPESEKLYDREMAMNTIKLVKKLGWDIVRKKR